MEESIRAEMTKAKAEAEATAKKEEEEKQRQAEEETKRKKDAERSTDIAEDGSSSRLRFENNDAEDSDLGINGTTGAEDHEEQEPTSEYHTEQNKSLFTIDEKEQD